MGADSYESSGKELVRSLDPSTKSALEISGNTWGRRTNFKKFKALDYPDYDVCAGPVPGEKFDVIIAEQVFEHLLWPISGGQEFLRFP